MALISQMDPTEAGELLYRKFMAAHEANKGGAPEDHPSRDVQKWNRIAATGGTGSENQIERTDHGADNPPDFAGKPANPAQDARVALDEATEECRIRNSGAADMESQLTLMRARRSNPATVRGMAKALGPSYNRLR
ncbi:MAG TPA: hypothetical protein VN325_35455 [Steroidobacteraceae bacterium]|nr:hypothetical protein [Steroidobacteraceae bacterium]